MSGLGAVFRRIYRVPLNTRPRWFIAGEVTHGPDIIVAIDSSWMLQDAEGDPVRAAGDQFVVHMDRESLDDFPELGKYDVTVDIKEFEQDRLISWTVLGQIQPPIGHVYGYALTPADNGSATIVTSFYDWSNIDPKWREAGIFPILSEGALRATLGILDRMVRRAYPHG